MRGLNALAASVCTPLAAPVITGTRLRGGTANSARAAASFVTEQITAARQTGTTGDLVVRGDSAFYSAAVVGACLDARVKAAIAAIDDDAWTPIKYQNAIWDDQAGCWVCEAEVAEIRYTAFTANAAWLTLAAITHNLMRPPPAWPPCSTPRPAAPPCAAS